MLKSIRKNLYTEEEKERILEKAENTEYKNPRFFLDEGKTVAEVIEYFAKSNFHLDVIRNYMSGPNKIIGLEEYLKENEIGIISRSDIVYFCVNTKQWKPLVLRCSGPKGGTDRGKLKIETFLIKRGIVE